MISCLYTCSMQGETLPLDHSLGSASRATVVVAWTPPVGEKEKVHRPYRWRISSGIYASKESRAAADPTLSSDTLIYRLSRRKKKNKTMKVRQVDNSHVASLHVNASVCLFHRSLKTASSLTYRGTSTCGILCQEVYWSCRNTPPTSHISPSTTWD